MISGLYFESWTLMLGKLSTVLYLVVAAAVTAFTWAAFVPGSLSPTTFGSVLATAIGLWGVSTIALRSSRPDPSVVQVLYETEHPNEIPERRGLGTRRASTTRR